MTVSFMVNLIGSFCDDIRILSAPPVIILVNEPLIVRETPTFL
jgi:hypothetical protein